MIRSYYWLLLLPLIPLAIVALYLFPEEKPLLDSKDFPHSEELLLTRPSSWSTSGDIQQLPPKLFGELSYNGAGLLTEKIDPLYWVAGVLRGDGSGRFRSAPFRAPKWISLTVSGDLTRPGNDLYFVLDGESKRVPVRVRTDERYWRRVTLELPYEWQGKPIRMIAEAEPRTIKNWFGFSNPRALGNGTVLATQLKTLRFLPIFVVALFLFLLPGLPLATLLVQRRVVAPQFVLPLAAVVSSCAGYLAFWIYFFNPTLGRYFTGLLLVINAAWLLNALMRPGAMRSLLLSTEVRTPLVLTILVGLFYTTLVYSVDLEVGVEGQVNLRFFEFTLAVDNEIPFLFADPLYNGQDVREKFPERVPGWHTSDRPPLQTGLVLLQLWLGYLLKEPRVYALIVGIALQCAWVSSVWAIWCAANLNHRRAGLALLFVVLAGFALVNTAFTWPKMLSAALALFSICIALFHRGSSGEALPFGRACLLGISAALAFLAHAGVAFTLLPFGLFLLVPRYYPGLSRLVVAGAIFVLMVCPWFLYQKYYDPPGNKLVRQHLAGDLPSWQENHSLPRNILDAYASTNIAEVWKNKLQNVRMLFMASQTQYAWPPHESPTEWPLNATGFRRCDFMALFWSLGLLNIGWAAALASRWRHSMALDSTLGVTLPVLGLGAVAVWIILMFGPASTVIHQGSYATILLLFASLAAWLTMLPGRLPNALLCAQGVIFFVGWLWTSPANSFGPPNLFMIVAAAITFAQLLRVALWPVAKEA